MQETLLKMQSSMMSRAAEKCGSQCIVIAIDAKRVNINMSNATGEPWFDDPTLKDVCLKLSEKIPPIPPFPKGGKEEEPSTFLLKEGEPQKESPPFIKGGEGGLWAISTHA